MYTRHSITRLAKHGSNYQAYVGLPDRQTSDFYHYLPIQSKQNMLYATSNGDDNQYIAISQMEKDGMTQQIV